jgi:TetR/AcrR family transcriptional regulator, regulator of mycofactocin system
MQAMVTATAAERGPGRPRSTTREQVGRVALELFAADGFDATTLDDIGAAVGISRRSLFRYFPSKNDMVWGEFEQVLGRLRTELEAAPADLPLIEAVGRAVVASNSYPRSALPELRIRMTLITTVPALQAHSMLRYAAWRRVVAEFSARRLGVEPDDLVAGTIAHLALGTAMAAFVRWVSHPEDDLEDDLRRGFALLARGSREST